MIGCTKKYTDPSSLRKHVKNHTYEEQRELKKRTANEPNHVTRRFVVKKEQVSNARTSFQDHSYSEAYEVPWQVHRVGGMSLNVKQDLKNKIKNKRIYF